MKRIWLWLVALLTALWPALPALAAQPFEPENERERHRQAMYCFLDSAFGAEYYASTNRMVRWSEPLRVYMCGSYTDSDIRETDLFLSQLNERVVGFPGASRVNSRKQANVVMTFTPYDAMADAVTNYVEGWGYTTWWYNSGYSIYYAEIAIASDVTDQGDRNHLIREELVNMLGLGNDIYTYSDSVIYMHWTGVETLSDLDWLMLNCLYSSAVYPGVTSAEAYAALCPLLPD